MALTKCKECGSEVSSKATACPKCGSPLKRKSLIVPIGCGGFLFILIVAIIGGNVGEGRPMDPRYSAQHFAEEIVKQNLKAPSTAKFAEEKVLEIQWDGNKKVNHCLVQLEVDSQNSFGAMIRNRFLVCLRLNSKGDECKWSEFSACQSFDHVPGKDEIELMKTMNAWPEKPGSGEGSHRSNLPADVRSSKTPAAAA